MFQSILVHPGFLFGGPPDLQVDAPHPALTSPPFFDSVQTIIAVGAGRHGVLSFSR